MPRKRRLKPDHLNIVIYHCISRTVNKEFLWGESAKEMFVQQMWKVAYFCGVQILSYCIMSNHFHILVQVRKNASAQLSQEELMDRVIRLYTNEKDQALVAYLRACLLGSDSEAQTRIRKQLLARMDDVSQFMKILKQRYSIWFNRQHRRIGTHWCERFRSLVVENQPKALLTVAAYILFNPVRAGICKNPAEYRYSCLAAAKSGRAQAIQAINALMGFSAGQTALERLQEFLRPNLSGENEPASVSENPQNCFSPGRARTCHLLQKASQLTSGMVLGSSQFLQKMIDLGQILRTRQTQIHALAEQNDLVCFRKALSG